MKIAVCYRGFLRTFKKTFFNHVENLFQDHDIDIFCHTWDSQYQDEISFLKELKYTKLFLIEKPKKFENNIFEDLFFQNKINTSFSKHKKLTDSGFHSVPYNVLSQLYSIKQSYQLCKSFNKNYDLVCSLRPDIFFQDKINFFELNNNSLNITWFEEKGRILNLKNSIVDHFCIGDEEKIDTYSDTFLFINFLYFIKKTPLIPETLIGEHLNLNNIKVNMLNTTHTVLRIENYDHLNNIGK